MFSKFRKSVGSSIREKDIETEYVGRSRRARFVDWPPLRAIVSRFENFLRSDQLFKHPVVQDLQ
jgi:hypothetical protein